jgi:hypothetical protein
MNRMLAAPWFSADTGKEVAAELPGHADRLIPVFQAFKAADTCDQLHFLSDVVSGDVIHTTSFVNFIQLL